MLSRMPTIWAARSTPSASFRSAVRRWLPKARVAVDHFHLVKLGNDMLTGMRRRVSWDRHDRRGRKSDFAWAHRLLLLRGYNTLSSRGREKLNQVLRTDDPTDEIGAAWGIKEQLRLTLMSTTLTQARERKATFDQYIAAARLPEADRLKKTIDS